MSFEVIQGDCLDAMRGLPPASVDACITDPPYGTTACAWDSVVPFAPMWAELKRIVKPKGAIVLFGSQPFTSALVMSNSAMFRYCWYWYKNMLSGFQLASIQPLRAMEEVVVFYAEQPTYNKQPTSSRITDRVIKIGRRNGRERVSKKDHRLGTKPQPSYFREYVSPWNVLEVPCEPRANGTVHPTQKPVDLLRYLVRTYTNAGDTVLDFTCGSGTTGVACEIEGRNSINIDSDGHYCEVSRARMLRASGIAADIPRRVKEYPPAPLFEAVEAA